MKNLFESQDFYHIQKRIEKLSPQSKALWGKMNVAQMLAHVNEGLETAMGKNYPKRMFLGMLFGPIYKKKFLASEHMPKNLMTDASYIFPASVDFAQQKEKVLQNLQQFHENGHRGCTDHPHIFFGKFTPAEWAIVQYKHFHHHLRQFGV